MKNNKKYFIGTAIILIVLLLVVWIFSQRNNQTEILGTVIRPDLQREISAENPEEFLREIEEIKSENFPRDSILKIELAENRIIGRRVLGVSEILEIFSDRVPNQLKETLVNEFMLGLYTDGGESRVFLIARVNSPQLARAGMREWEENILEDLSGLFGFESNFTNISFQNDLIRNQSVRVALGPAGNPVLIYSFWREDVLFITTDRETFRKIFDVFLISR